MDFLTAAGLGLDYGALQFGRTTEAWLGAGIELSRQVATALDGLEAGVEVVGSSSVLNLLAKPIIDLAVGLRGSQPLAPVSTRLEALDGSIAAMPAIKAAACSSWRADRGIE